MKKLILVAMSVGLLLSSSSKIKASEDASLLADILLARDYPNECIGGQICGVEKSYLLDVDDGYKITKVIVTADDNIGSSHNAHLQCYVDGVFSGELDVKAAGSTLTFFPNVVGRKIELVSVRENHSLNGDETMIHYVAAYGQKSP